MIKWKVYKNISDNKDDLMDILIIKNNRKDLYYNFFTWFGIYQNMMDDDNVTILFKQNTINKYYD
jgi:hypothetical protein